MVVDSLAAEEAAEEAVAGKLQCLQFMQNRLCQFGESIFIM